MSTHSYLLKANHLPGVTRLLHDAVAHVCNDALALESLPQLLQEHLLLGRFELFLLGLDLLVVSGQPHTLVLALLDCLLCHPIAVVLIEVLLPFQVQLPKDLRGRQGLSV